MLWRYMLHENMFIFFLIVLHYQIISNGEYKSVQHRVIANSSEEPRISIAVFFNPGKKGELDLYGPLPELISIEKLAQYCYIKISEFIRTFQSKELGSKFLQHFRLPWNNKCWAAIELSIFTAIFFCKTLNINFNNSCLRISTIYNLLI